MCTFLIHNVVYFIQTFFIKFSRCAHAFVLLAKPLSFKPHRHNNGINLGNEEETARSRARLVLCPPALPDTWWLSYVCLPLPPTREGSPTSELRGRIRSAASDKLGNNCCHSQMRAATTSAEYAPLTLAKGRARGYLVDDICGMLCNQPADVPKIFCMKHVERSDCDSTRIKCRAYARRLLLTSV